MKQSFAAIILGGTGQVGGAAVVELLAIPECREVVMVTRKPSAPRSRVRSVVLDTGAAEFAERIAALAREVLSQGPVSAVSCVGVGSGSMGWSDWAVIVGVVHHVQYHSLTAIVRPQIYVPYPLAPRPSMSFILHTSSSDSGLAVAVRNTVDAVNKDLPITQVEPMQLLVDRAHAESRFTSLLATLLSVIALVLATSGIYGVLSYSVAQRTTEIGIRMAIGAPRAQVLRMILADGFAWILPGLLAGLLLCLVVTPLLAQHLYGVEPTNLANYP